MKPGQSLLYSITVLYDTVQMKQGWFLDMGIQTSTIKLTMASTLEWWRRFPPLLVCLFYICTL